MTCIRRAHTFWTTCKCPPCTTDRLRMSKRARTIGVTRVTSDEAWAVIDGLLAQGWTGQAIASSAGLARRSIEGALVRLHSEGRRVKFGPTVSAALVNHGQPTVGMVGAHGARRRLQGLAMQGWDLYRLANLCTLNYSTLAAIRAGQTERINASKWTEIAALTERVGLSVGGSTQARQNAIRKGWVSLFAWDDLDDVHEQPRGTGRGDELIDDVVVRRILDGDPTPARAATPAERRAVVAAWAGSLGELERLTGWRAGRYVERVA